MHTKSAHTSGDEHLSDDVIGDLKSSMILLVFVALIWVLGAAGLLVSLM